MLPYSPEWSEAYKREADAIKMVVDNLIISIEHVGSTAVPGLPAKPILDIAIAVKEKSIVSQVVKLLVAAGYVDMGDQGDEGGYLMTRYAAPDVRICHLHIVAISNFQWRNYIDFRDILRNNPVIRDDYARLKQQLAAQFPNDRESYMYAKYNFIRKTLKNR